MGWLIAIYGGLGGICMPLMKLAQDLIDGKSFPQQLATLEGFCGWVVGISLFLLIGAAVAWAIEQSNSQPAKALVIGLTLPATITALGHGGNVGLGHTALFSIISPAQAQSAVAINTMERLLKLCNNKCKLLLYDSKGSITQVKPLTDALNYNNKSLIISPGTATISLETPKGISSRVAIPETRSGQYILNAEPRSNFSLGLRTALGLPAAPYELELR
jgi:hypothetical protein